MTILAAHRARLKKLAAYLESLSPRYRHFNMSWWIGGSDSARQREYALRNGGVASCGTSACAAGHGPAAGILVPKQFVFSKGVAWQAYAMAHLCGGSATLNYWLFDGDWDDVDNHHYGAAARIRYALKHGSAPKGFTSPGRKWRAAYAEFRKPTRGVASAMSAGTAETAEQAQGQRPASAVAEGETPKTPSNPDTPNATA